MPGRAEVEEFVRQSFRSVWALEVLGYLRDHPDRSHSPAELVEALRASDAVVSRCLENLALTGLIAREADGTARYSPASPELDGLAAAAQRLYAVRPDAVRRIIAMAANPTIAAFADAFRLKKDGE